MKLEVLDKDFTYHIYNRGINGENIFITDENKRYFLQLLGKYLDLKADILAYCLMDNHFHLLIYVKSDTDTITQALSNFFNAYAKAFNKAAERTGSLFEKHFKRIRVAEDEYLRKLIVYIHMNPKHHFDMDFTKYKYSSYNAYLSVKETKVERAMGLNLFGDKENFVFVHHQKNDLIEESLMLE